MGRDVTLVLRVTVTLCGRCYGAGHEDPRVCVWHGCCIVNVVMVATTTPETITISRLTPVQRTGLTIYVFDPAVVDGSAADPDGDFLAGADQPAELSIIHDGDPSRRDAP